MLVNDFKLYYCSILNFSAYSLGELITLLWPPQSPDLNPIEQFFDFIKAKMPQMARTSEKAVWESLQQIWNRVTIKDLLKYVNTMPDRCRAVIEAKGYSTRY